ncbi:hypothetical protein [Flavobacterium sp.]|jgi:hypothetical protein|uniref:hypothetical protein n=1 Tax=Flavobacterium sp. TaxID=239 RepID=UPI002A822503|nr:hypothetical protein [Flavobacterium sp.]
MNIYNKIFVSSIYTAKRSSALRDMWKFTCIFYPTISMTFNFMLLGLFINEKFFSTFFYSLEIRIVENGAYNFLFNILLYLIIPLYMFNYYNVLYNEKYKKMIEENKESYNKKIISIYLILSLVSPIIYLLSIVEYRP